jgi:Methyltransferase FkbM domain
MIDRALKRLFFALGLNLTKQVDEREVLSLIRKLRPQDCGIKLRRAGGGRDGGYLIPDDLDGIEYCFSPGVSTASRFEDNLADMRIRSFLADYSVDAPPVNRPELTFDKKFLGATDCGNFFTLATWKDKYLKGYWGDMLLQMDIEGFEYQVILNAPGALLNQFRIVVVEFHHLHRLFDRFDFEIMAACFNKLLEQFYVVHIHPNNFATSFRRNGIEIPSSMEFTFLNKRRANHCEPQTVFPHPLDEDNEPSASLHLPRCWYSES